MSVNRPPVSALAPIKMLLICIHLRKKTAILIHLHWQARDSAVHPWLGKDLFLAYRPRFVKRHREIREKNPVVRGRRLKVIRIIIVLNSFFKPIQTKWAACASHVLTGFILANLLSPGSQQPPAKPELR